jgi:monoamine oxidase
METETLIIGAGLAGLSLAAQLSLAKRDFLLVEARNRLGGRILTETIQGGHFDLGPAWFWQGQPRIAVLIDQLGLKVFEHYSDGALLLEDARGNVAQESGFAPMQGSMRLQGGLAALIKGLSRQIPKNRQRLATPVVNLSRGVAEITAHCATGQPIRASRVVLALPPRLANEMTFVPPLPPSAVSAMTGTATWMAGQAKTIVVYDRPFWREAGLSGGVMSQLGPMVEIHDASPRIGGLYALFGFLGLPAQYRTEKQAMEHQILAQLTRLFGDAAASPLALVTKDWAYEVFTSTDLDRKPLRAHPRYGMPRALERLWDGMLIFGGSETAFQFGGYLEGALEAAEHTLALINTSSPE